MLLRLFLFLLHLDDLILQLLILQHQELILGVQLRYTVQSAIDFDTKSLGCLVNPLAFGRGLL